MIDSYQANQPHIVRAMHLHEIDKAIGQVKGPRRADPTIREIWERVRKSGRDENGEVEAKNIKRSTDTRIIR